MNWLNQSLRTVLLWCDKQKNYSNRWQMNKFSLCFTRKWNKSRWILCIPSSKSEQWKFPQINSTKAHILTKFRLVTTGIDIVHINNMLAMHLIQWNRENKSPNAFVVLFFRFNRFVRYIAINFRIVCLDALFLFGQIRIISPNTMSNAIC